MQQIADEAHIAKGTIYLYFSSREELIERLVTEAFTGLVDRLQAQLQEAGSTVERLRRLIRTQLEFFEENRQVLSVYMALRHGDLEAACANGGRRRHERPQYQRYLAMLTAFLEEAMRRNEIRRVDAKRVAFFVSEGLSSLLMRRLAEKPPPIDAEVEWISGLLLDGLAARRRA
jgi:AcrR family transcriptional regulator